MVDGIYTMTFRGAADWGMGMLVLRRGTITGADIGGCLYEGLYTEEPENIVMQLHMTVPAGATLVQGTKPQPKPYVLSFNLHAPKRSLETSTPILVQLPPGPVNVIVRRLKTLAD